MRIDEIFREIEEMHKKMTEDMLGDFGSLEEIIRNGEIEGDWRFEPIDRDGMKGFIARGFFSTPNRLPGPNPLERPTDILPPLRPRLREPREPLYDISIDGDRLTVFIELPGVEEEDIRLDTEDRKLKLEAKDFKTEIDLSSWVLRTEDMTREYRNGVLKVVFPRTELDEQLI
jgi:HSP20 family molecular chaperone IbpA